MESYGEVEEEKQGIVEEGFVFNVLYLCIKLLRNEENILKGNYRQIFKIY